MAIDSMNLPISPPADISPVRRVEPRSGARDFDEGRQRRQGRAHHEGDQPGAARQDVVDLSDTYCAEPSSAAQEGTESALVYRANGSDRAERHIDISA